MKKILSIMMALVIVFPLFSSINAKADDVTGITLETEMRAIINAGIMSGYEDGTYRPGNQVTREEFATFLARALQLPDGPERFHDVAPSSKLAPYIWAAAEAGIINGGTDGNFNPKATIIRKDMALMINNALNYMNKQSEYVAPPFTDLTGISSVHMRAIGQSVNLGIISGFPDGTFRPDDRARRDQAAAFIYRMLDGNLPEPPPKLYQTANIDSAGTVTLNPVSYETFDFAKQAMTKSGDELVTKEGKIVYMKDNSGLVFAKGGTTARLYTDEAMKNDKTYVVASAIGSSGISTEMQYVTATDDYVRVYIGGDSYYMKHSDALLVPYEGMPGRSYYTASNGKLLHYIYNIDQNRHVFYDAGPAPAFMQAGTPYYSWDGFTFYDSDGREVGRAYQYFQFLSARMGTSYTAEELDQFIMTALAEREATGLTKYKEATKKSKLIGLGTIAKKVEAQYNVSALLIISMAIHESDYGISSHAQNANNLFGIAVFDSAPSTGAKFASVEEGVVHLASAYFLGTAGDWRGGYLTPNTWRAYGAAPGNKGLGINVKYASDPFWGAKVAGHMYRIDQALGGKEFAKQYTLGFTNTADLNVRISPSGSLLYTYEQPQMPVTILEDGEWAKVASDVPTRADAYIYSRYMNKLPIAK